MRQRKTLWEVGINQKSDYSPVISVILLSCLWCWCLPPGSCHLILSGFLGHHGIRAGYGWTCEGFIRLWWGPMTFFLSLERRKILWGSEKSWWLYPLQPIFWQAWCMLILVFLHFAFSSCHLHSLGTSPFLHTLTLLSPCCVCPEGKPHLSWFFSL